MSSQTRDFNADPRSNRRVRPENGACGQPEGKNTVLRVIVDSREQRPLDFSRWPEVALEVAGLPAGDYSLRGLETSVAIERKSLDDLVGSLSSGRDRFEAELCRVRGYALFAIVVEGSMQDVAEHHYRSRMQPHAVLQSLIAFQVRYGVPTIWAGSPTGAAYVAKSLLEKYLREHTERLRAIVRAHGSAV